VRVWGRFERVGRRYGDSGEDGGGRTGEGCEEGRSDGNAGSTGDLRPLEAGRSWRTKNRTRATSDESGVPLREFLVVEM